MLRLVRDTGVFSAYLENVVFNAEMIRMREMIEAGAIGRLTTFRAREAHSGPHADHFWDADLAGGGALLDMASHGAEAARAMFGKDLPVRDVFAWGDTLVHGGRTRLEDNAVMLIRFEDGRVATMDVSWSAKGGLESRFEAYGEGGKIIQDVISSPLRAFIERPAGYLGEKVDADTGWVYPVPNETYAHGHDAMMADVVSAFRDGRQPQETFEDGLIVNSILDAAYRSMESGGWEAVETHAGAVVG
jgi:predicted dehydrogenase